MMYFMTPFPYFIGFALALLLTLKFNKVFRWIFAFYIIFLFTIFCPLGPFLKSKLESTYLPLNEIEPKEAVVVLAGGTIYKIKSIELFQYGSMADRALEGIRLLKEEKVKLLLAAEGIPPEKNSIYSSEGDTMYSLGTRLGIDPKRIQTIRGGGNTYEEALLMKKELDGRNIKDFYLITSATHLPRAQAVFEKVGLSPTPFPVKFSPSTLTGNSSKIWGAPFHFFHWLYEFLATLKYKAKGYL